MVNRYNIKLAYDIEFKGRFGTYPRAVCPQCIVEVHEQGESSEVYDCKNLFLNDKNEIVGQCCCYSEVHGVRDD